MKKIHLLLIGLFMVSLSSCNDDDNVLPPLETPAANVFCYGDGTLSFDVTGAFRGQTLQISNDAIRTQVSILGDGLSLNEMDQIEGIGAIIELDFFGNTTQGFQSGLYEISDLQESANASGSYSISYDPTVTTNSFNTLDSGLIRVSPYNNGYLIEIDAVDSNGDDFHGNYFGLVQSIN